MNGYKNENKVSKMKYIFTVKKETVRNSFAKHSRTGNIRDKLLKYKN